MAERVQQSKLAALGRLSASIAHEIRNPVGAMSHAGQLLAESPNIGPDERRLTDIIRNNSERVSTIINNVLQLSRREATKPTRLSLGDWLEEFLAEFSRNHASPDGADRRAGGIGRPRGALRPQPSCTKWSGTCATTPSNTARRATGSRSRSSSRRLNPSYRPYLEVADRGSGHRTLRRPIASSSPFSRAQGRHRARALHRPRTCAS